MSIKVNRSSKLLKGLNMGSSKDEKVPDKQIEIKPDDKVKEEEPKIRLKGRKKNPKVRIFTSEEVLEKGKIKKIQLTNKDYKKEIGVKRADDVLQTPEANLNLTKLGRNELQVNRNHAVISNPLISDELKNCFIDFFETGDPVTEGLCDVDRVLFQNVLSLMKYYGIKTRQDFLLDRVFEIIAEGKRTRCYVTSNVHSEFLTLTKTCLREHFIDKEQYKFFTQEMEDILRRK